MRILLEKNFKTKLALYSKPLKNPISIEASNLSFDKLKTFADACGRNVKEIKIRSIWTQFTASNVFFILKQMPELQKIDLEHCPITFDEWNAPLEKRIKLDELKLPKLKSLSIKGCPEVFRFFSELLHENSIIEFRCRSSDLRNYKEDFFEAAREFFENQKSIKKFESSRLEILNALNVLRPDEIILSNKEYYERGYRFETEFQPQLKSLKILTYFHESFAKDLSKLTNLEKLEVGAGGKFNMNHLRNFQNGQFESITKLSLGCNGIFTADILFCFPNLKSFHGRSSINLNSFAKFLPKLNNLQLELKANRTDSRTDSERIMQICELNSGIKNKSLKCLDLKICEENISRFDEEFQELAEIFPNLKVFRLKCEWDFESISITAGFLKALNEFKKLKIVKIETLSLQYSMDEWREITIELNKLSQSEAINEVLIYFYDGDPYDDENEKISYKEYVKYLSRKYRTRPSFKKKSTRESVFWLVVLYKKAKKEKTKKKKNSVKKIQKK